MRLPVPTEDIPRFPDRKSELDRRTAAMPLLRIKGPKLTQPLVKVNGVESDIAVRADADERYDQIIHASHRYARAGQISSFPLVLELEALRRAITEHLEDHDLRLRLQMVLSDITSRVAPGGPSRPLKTWCVGFPFCHDPCGGAGWR